MGDIVSLAEKAQEAFDQEKAAELEKRISKNQLTLEDFMDQMEQINGMGGLGKVMDMIPGAAGKITEDQLDEGEKEFRRFRAVYNSMTKAERKNPQILDASRRKRIAAGAGVSVTVVNKLIKNFTEVKQMMKKMNNPKMQRMLKRRGLF